MTNLPFLRGFLRTLVGLRDSSRGYVMRSLRSELLRLSAPFTLAGGGPPDITRADVESLVAALAP